MTGILKKNRWRKNFYFLYLPEGSFEEMTKRRLPILGG
jgi:hypothetical protein